MPLPFKTPRIQESGNGHETAPTRSVMGNRTGRNVRGEASLDLDPDPAMFEGRGRLGRRRRKGGVMATLVPFGRRDRDRDKEKEIKTQCRGGRYTSFLDPLVAATPVATRRD